METYNITFSSPDSTPPRHIQVPGGTIISAAARLAGVEIPEPCGGQGRCGRCIVQVMEGQVRRRSALRLSPQDVAQGYALGCQTVIESDAAILVPAEEKIERRLTTSRAAAPVHPPAGFSPHLCRVTLSLSPPTLENQVDDWNRLQTALRQQTGIPRLEASLPILRKVGTVLRQGDWQATAVIELDANAGKGATGGDDASRPARLVALLPGHIPAGQPLWGAAIDIGTTTVTVWLVDLITGEVGSQAAEYNRQIARGEDVISRIIYASRDAACQAEMRSLVLDTIHALLNQVCHEAKIQTVEIVRAAIAGNSTMMHLFLGIPAASIRLSPFITAANHFSLLPAREIGLALHPEAMVDCLPGVASYVGSDITAGALACELDQAEELSLFMDVGTNGETVLGCRDWLVTCACSAGPAFEGAGVENGMRASAGAIEEVWINPATLEPSYRTIGNLPPRGLCGSGLISLLSELFRTGIIDKAGHFATVPNPRLRPGEHGPEYVVTWASNSAHNRDIVITRVDIDNLLRAKAAMYAGFDVLASQVGLSLDAIQRVLVGGSFGRYINIETAVQIGLLPDMPWDRFAFLGNTAVRGAYLALVDRHSRARLDLIAARMTYIELSTDNTFYDAFMAALFLPHTDLSRFPSLHKQENGNRKGAKDAKEEQRGFLS